MNQISKHQDNFIYNKNYNSKFSGNIDYQNFLTQEKKKSQKHRSKESQRNKNLENFLNDVINKIKFFCNEYEKTLIRSFLYIIYEGKNVKYISTKDILKQIELYLNNYFSKKYILEKDVTTLNNFLKNYSKKNSSFRNFIDYRGTLKKLEFSIKIQDEKKQDTEIETKQITEVTSSYKNTKNKLTVISIIEKEEKRLLHKISLFLIKNRNNDFNINNIETFKLTYLNNLERLFKFLTLNHIDSSEKNRLINNDFTLSIIQQKYLTQIEKILYLKKSSPKN